MWHYSVFVKCWMEGKIKESAKSVSGCFQESRARQDSIRVLGWCNVHMVKMPPLAKACQSHCYTKNQCIFKIRGFNLEKESISPIYSNITEFDDWILNIYSDDMCWCKYLAHLHNILEFWFGWRSIREMTYSSACSWGQHQCGWQALVFRPSRGCDSSAVVQCLY